jgi:hypothetical protein
MTLSVNLRRSGVGDERPASTHVTTSRCTVESHVKESIRI